MSDLTPDLKTRLSAMMIEFSHTRSQKTLWEMNSLLLSLEDPGQIFIAEKFVLMVQFLTEHSLKPASQIPKSQALS